YKQVASIFAARMADEARRFPRSVSIEAAFASLLPELILGLGAVQFAAIAARALTPREPPTVGVMHLHQPLVSVREQAAVVVDRLRRHRSVTFRALSADCENTLVVVARFLALLELYREGVVAFEQVSALGELHIRWTGADEGGVEVTDEFDVTVA